MRQHNLRVTGSLTVNGENVVSASQLSALNSTLTGQYATTGSNMYNGNQTITGSVIVTGTITANEFHTTFVTSSVLYTSGSTKFGDTNDDIMEVTGSLKVDGNITANNLSGIVSGSTQITSLLPTGVVSGSSQLTASYDVRYVISGSITQTTWDNIASKPAGIVSSSAQVILQSTTGQLSASRVDGLNLTQIGSGSYTASIGQTFNVNTNTIITGSLSVSSLSGSGVNYLAYSGGVVTAISGTAAIKYNQEFTATLGQTIFTPSVGYVSGLIDVYYNGTKLSTTDYTATNGSTIVLSQGADLAGDIVEVAIYNPVSGVSNNVLRQQTTFTASASQTTFTVNYTPGLLDVYFNGSRLSNEEYTANNGTSIILTEATTGGEIIDIFVYSYQVGAFSGVGGSGVTNQLTYWSSQSGLTGSNSLTFDGTTLTISGSLVPAVSGAYDLGSTSKPFRHIYVGSGSIFLVNNEGQVTNTISAQSIVTTDTLNSGSIDLTKSLPTGTVSGSSQIVGILSSLNTATASFTPRISNLESKSASVDISISNINSVTASNIARLSNLESKSASVDITISSINSKTGSYATTGSNSFYGTQVFSGSVYIANDLVVQGSSSIQYISASSVSIGTNIVQLNTANPSVRFAGLTIIDSGSIGGSGSFLYDSVQDEFIFVHRGNGTNVTSSHFVLGPETYDSLGNETYLTTNIIPKGTGKEHLVDSCIFDNGTTTCIKNNLIGTGTAYFNGCIGIGALSGSGYRLEITNPSCVSGYVNVFYGLHTGNNTFTIRQFGSSHPTAAAVNQIGVLNKEQHLHLVTDDQACIDTGTSKNGIFIKSGGNIGIGMQSPSEKLEVCGALKINGQLCSTGISTNSTYIDQTGGTARFLSYGPNSTTRGAITFFQASSTNAFQFTGLTLDPSGNATFGGNICSGTINGTTIYGSTAVCSPVGLFSGCVGIGTASPSQKLHVAGTVHLGVGGGATAGDVTGVLSIGNTGTYYMTQIKTINTASNPGILKPRMGFFTLSGTGETAADLTEKMSITADTGYVGIGTCTPAYSLSVKSGWIHNYGAQNASGFRYENDASGHVLNLNANNSYAQLYTSTDTSLYFGTNNNLSVKISNTGETCFKCNVHFCASTYGIMGFGEKVMDKICYITTTSGTLCVPLDGLTYSSNFATRAIYLYGTLLDNDAAHYAHMLYFYRNDYGGLQTSTISQASLVHPSTAGQAYTFSVNDPGSTGKGACTLLLRFTSAGAGVSAGNYCTKMRIVVYNVPGL